MTSSQADDRLTSLQLYDVARRIIAERQDEPLDPDTDLTSALLAKQHKGEPLPPGMVLGTVRQMIVVGMIAPSVFIGTMAAHLAGDAELQRQLRGDLTLVPAAVEEFLRLYTPYRGFARTASIALDGNVTMTRWPEWGTLSVPLRVTPA